MNEKKTKKLFKDVISQLQDATALTLEQIYEMGRSEGYDEGYDDGYQCGMDAVFEDNQLAYNRGYDDGYNCGYDDGYNDYVVNTDE